MRKSKFLTVFFVCLFGFLFLFWFNCNPLLATPKWAAHIRCKQNVMARLPHSLLLAHFIITDVISVLYHLCLVLGGRIKSNFLIIEITSHYFSSKYLPKLAAVWESACKGFFCIWAILLWGAEKDLSNKLLMSVLTKTTKVISCLNSATCRSFHW